MVVVIIKAIFTVLVVVVVIIRIRSTSNNYLLCSNNNNNNNCWNCGKITHNLNCGMVTVKYHALICQCPLIIFVLNNCLIIKF